ncbi:hypothetical protein, partial [Rhodovarius lipocyclicus]|uniref:hypothetical protein n=1 Tax=Rhodovarius lipocyclicus TaxID=268410 RepID=UPI001F2A9D55
FRPELTATAKNLQNAACSGDADAESRSTSPSGRFLKPLFSSLLERFPFAPAHGNRSRYLFSRSSLSDQMIPSDRMMI